MNQSQRENATSTAPPQPLPIQLSDSSLTGLESCHGKSWLGVVGFSVTVQHTTATVAHGSVLRVPVRANEKTLRRPSGVPNPGHLEPLLRDAANADTGSQS